MAHMPQLLRCATLARITSPPLLPWIFGHRAQQAPGEIKMTRWLWAALVLLLGVTPAQATLVECNSATGASLLPAQGLEDPERQLTPEQVADLPDADFSAEADWPHEGYSRSAYWLRFNVQNTGDVLCSRWLSFAEPAMDNIQVFVLRDGQWSEMHAGSHYPLAEWPVKARQLLFPLSLAPGEQVTVVAKVLSDSVMLIEPRMWTELEHLRKSQSTYLVDGLALGIVILVVPFSLVVAMLMRSRLLLFHSTAVLSYLLLVCVAKGYLMYLPALQPWVEEVVSVLSCAACMLLVAYLGELFKVSRLPLGWRWLMNAFGLFLGAILLWGAFGDYLLSRIVFDEVRWVAYFIVPLTCLAAWFYGLRPNWVAWQLTVLFVLQGVVRHVFDVKNTSWQYGEDPLGLLSILPGVFLLACTLIMEFNRSRRSERHALADLEAQQQAEHERLESTVELRTGQLLESLRARSSLMARISHDLRSPLVSIIDSARQLRTETQHESPLKIERNARQQLAMIDELLEFSRSELQQLELVLAPGYLYGFLREVEDEGRSLAVRQDNQFSCQFAGDLPLLVRADFRRLRQILINLLVNAAKFTREGRIDFAVECVDVGEQTVCLRFVVSDSGMGMHPEERELLLQPFRRGRNAGRYEGTGLGLSIVVELLQQMGGELQVSSDLAWGSCFSFELQLLRAREDELEMVIGEGYAESVRGNGRQVLVVDDIEQNREGISDLLAGHGFDVRVATDGREALALLEQQPVDLLISDQMMPDLDGWALLKAVRGRWPDVPVLLYSAAPPLRPAGMDRGLVFDAALLKPATSDELLTRIAALLHKAESPVEGVEQGRCV